MRKTLHVFLNVLLITSGHGILMTIVYSSPLWFLILLYSLFNPGLAMVCILFCVFCECICFNALGRVKFSIFCANNNLRSLIHVFNNKNSRNRLIQYWLNPENESHKGLSEWFIDIAENTFVVLDPSEIDFGNRIIHEECVFFEDTFRRRAFCESWEYHVYHIRKNNGDLHKVMMTTGSEFIDWVYWHQGSISDR